MKSPAAASAPDKSSTVLLIIDLINDFEFPDGARIRKAALPVARTVQRLKARANQAGLATIYVNDNFGRWRSDFRQLVDRSEAPKSRGKAIVERVKPAPTDYFILKPTHAAFFGTALECLLKEMTARRLILTGISAHQCILFTANEAYLRGYELLIPRDCVASKTARQKTFALEYFRTVLGADTRSSARIRLPASVKWRQMRTRLDQAPV